MLAFHHEVWYIPGSPAIKKLNIRKEVGVNTVSRRPRGFSIVELLVVMLIIVILAAASIPMGLNFVRHYKITGAAQNVAALVQRARAQAVKQNTGRGILLNFNYPVDTQIQFTSLDPSPMTGNWDGNFYPANPGVFDPGVTTDYGTVPTPPANIDPPDLASGVESPHGIPLQMPTSINFDLGARNALLFRADGSVAAVDAGGPAGNPAIVLAPNGIDLLITVRDADTNLVRVVRIGPGGRVRVDDFETP